MYRRYGNPSRRSVRRYVNEYEATPETAGANGLDYYTGQSKNGKAHGKGKMVFANGDEYEGEWKDGKMYGEGVYKYANGDVYNGEYKNGERHGKGKMIDAGRSEWVKRGNGRRVWRNGDEHDGEWKGDKMNGMGTFKRRDGMLFEGEFKDGIPQGRGLRKLADGSVEEFEWKDGKWHVCSTNEGSDLVEIVGALSVEDIVAQKVKMRRQRAK